MGAKRDAMLSVGMKLGPYEVVAPVGAGGMGEVYLARDTRLGRDVAVKVLPARFSNAAEFRERFEREARAISALNHSRICTLYDVGHQDGVDYLVMEYLEGETLAERLKRGALPLKETLRVGMEVCEALDVAHRAGIVHRDLKPANIMLTKSGVKLMDFGLAKASAARGGTGSGGNAPLLSAAETISGPSPMTPLTGAGQVVGTIQYMSPEQIEGKEADARSDIFALGAVLYEMATGKRPFEGKSQISVASAILEKEPQPIRTWQPLTPTAFERVVSTCLQKNPEERFQSAWDVRLELKWIAENPVAQVKASEGAGAAKLWTRALPWALVGILLAACCVAAWLFLRRENTAALLHYQQVTFDRGFVYAARFARDGSSVLYSATWEGQPLQIYSTEPGSPESRALNLAHSSLYSVSDRDLLISEGCQDRYIGNCQGTLAQVPISGGSPREIANDVVTADWSPDGSELALVRHTQGKYVLEYPRGKVIYETYKPMVWLRVAPDGKMLAVMESYEEWGDAGLVRVLDTSGKELTHSALYVSIEGMAWAPSGKEVWFGGTIENGWADAIYALRMNGKTHMVMRFPGELRLHDIAKDGRMLLSKESWRSDVMYGHTGEKGERKLPWLDYAGLRDMSEDGKWVSFADWGTAAGAEGLGFVRKTDGSPAVKLGRWDYPVISPDGKWVLASQADVSANWNSSVGVLPTGPGEVRKIGMKGIQQLQSLGWMPDGKAFYYAGEDGKGFRMYVHDLEGGATRAVTPVITVRSLYFETHLVSPDGKWIFARDTSGKPRLYPLDGGATRDVAGLEPTDVWIRWDASGREAYVYKDEKTSATVYRLDVNSGKREEVGKLAPADVAGVTSISNVAYTADGKTYAYSEMEELSELFVVGRGSGEWGEKKK
jgi:eukaryotic-like serine/threonine-protein kinase